MTTIFRPISHSWVAQHPDPIGVIEFLGGALYGTLPHVSYAHFLNCLYHARYTVIAVPFRLGFNHTAIAEGLLKERDRIRAELNYPATIPHVWVGHSLGCKYIVLLEALGQLFNQPSLLMAPDISDTTDALPIPALAQLLDRYNLGATPTRQAIQTLIQTSRLFNLTALISFENDTIAGNLASSPEASDVAWFANEFGNRSGSGFIKAEIAGGHREPVAIPIGKSVLRPLYQGRVVEPMVGRSLEPLAVKLLAELNAKLNGHHSLPIRSVSVRD
ncbi:DUF1350 family protein [Oscillatoria sp. FACHB-1407]|uniref:DUF1350 family protein n=1 Tax=Oscillatoria sp. FACHB-1407 TaxID=2692847 RepID=UPI001686BF74|nr:DUF1350 family protein [Oscillatoria sp. FACHB-1407]MBD2461750.1 DUF1350 family protein [Oscillatoria sp. FACHB-1407]